VCATADYFGTIERLNTKFDVTTVGADDFCVRDDPVADGRGRQMSYVDARTDSALASLEVRLDRFQRGVLHGHDHYWRCKHGRERRVLESVSKVFRGHNHREGALGT